MDIEAVNPLNQDSIDLLSFENVKGMVLFGGVLGGILMIASTVADRGDETVESAFDKLPEF